MTTPEMAGFSFFPGDEPQEIYLPVTEDIKILFDIAFVEAEKSLMNGDTPVGAVLLDRGSQQFWPAGSRDKTSKNIEEHAEKLSYRAGQQFVLDRLGNCAEITTLEPCIMCSATLAQGDIGRILAAAPREAVVRDDESSILRQRKLGLYAVLEDSDVRTHAYIGYNADRSVELWREWDDRITNKKRSIYLSR